MGRDTTFTDAIAAEIVERLSKGEPLAQICRDLHMPAVRTVSLWRSKHPTFDADFLRARDDGFDAIATECMDIADDGTQDMRTITDRSGKEIEAVDTEHIQRSKLRVETRLKLLAKWDPRRYGERQTIEHEVGESLAARMRQRGPLA